MKKSLSGKINVSGSLMISKGSWKKSNERQMLAVRDIKPGFPIEKPFESLKDIEKYLSGDRIVCLMCGKDYSALPTHLKTHGHTAESYKEKYKIPSNLGLIGKGLFDKLSIAAKKSHELGRIPNLGQIVKERYAEGMQRTGRSYKSIKEIENDAKKAARLAACAKAAHDKRLSKTHCNKGHLLKEIGELQCSQCAELWRVSQPGYSSREDSLKATVEIACTECGKATYSSKISSTRKIALCANCKKRKNTEAKNKFRADNPGYRHEEYLKRKAKLANKNDAG